MKESRLSLITDERMKILTIDERVENVLTTDESKTTTDERVKLFLTTDERVKDFL